MLFENNLFILLMIFIGILLANILLIELGKFFWSTKKTKHKDGNVTKSRRSKIFAFLCFFLLLVIDAVFVAWLLTSGKDDIMELLHFNNLPFL